MSGFHVRRIGIALAAYRPNVEIFARQLQSIAVQTFPDWICVITSDSPLDEFANDAMLKALRDDDRFVWIENAERLGHKNNFGKAIQECVRRGVDAIACSDQDDVWYREKLATCARELERTGPLSLVHSDLHVLKNDKILDSTTWQIEHRGVRNAGPAHLLVRNVVAGCAMLFDAALARKYPVIPPEAEYHDHWYALAASAHGGVHAIYQPLMAYRQHEGNVVGVTPFDSIFSLPDGITPAGIARKSRHNWEKSLRLAEAARREGMPIREQQMKPFLHNGDWGLGVGALGISHIRDDGMLFRACLVRSAGKVLATLGMRDR